MILGIGGEAGLMTQDVAYRQFRFPCLVRLKARIFIAVVGDIDRIIHKLLSDQVNDLRIKIKVLVTHQILQRIVDGIHLRIRCQIIERIIGDSGAVALATAILIVGVDSSPGLLKNELSIFYDSQLRAGKAMFNILLNDLVDEINGSLRNTGFFQCSILQNGRIGNIDLDGFGQIGRRNPGHLNGVGTVDGPFGDIDFPCISGSHLRSINLMVVDEDTEAFHTFGRCNVKAPLPMVCFE